MASRRVILAAIAIAIAPFAGGAIAVASGAPEWSPYAALGVGLIAFSALAAVSSSSRVFAATLVGLFAVAVGLRVGQGTNEFPHGAALVFLLVSAFLSVGFGLVVLFGGHAVLWNARRRVAFAQGMETALVIPPGPGSRPGERLLSFSESFFEPKLHDDGVRGDFRTLVGSGGSTVSAVCLGPVTDHGTPRESAAKALAEARVDELTKAQELKDDRIGGEPAVFFRLAGTAPCVAYDWRFNRGGWAFSAGVLCQRGDDEASVLQRTRALLGTWEWIEAE